MKIGLHLNKLLQHPTTQIPDFGAIVSDLEGIEIGGPSQIIQQMGLYTTAKSIDCICFSSNTLWHQNKDPQFCDCSGKNWENLL